ncbi:MAG: HlyC/CorC family transporter [Chloroflexi bacterium]|nr:MAG: HlyC/CorC family transporter [Chloroflexota bacterium]
MPTDGEVSGSVGGLLLFIGIALGISFLCSIWEAVMLSTSFSHIEVLIEQGKRAGYIMRAHKDNIERPISAILTLNTIAHTVGAAGAGAQAVGVFGNEFVGIISAVLTLLILIFSEIIPKTLGAAYWKQLMPFTAYSVRLLVIVLYPIVVAFQAMTSLLASKTEEPKITRSELEVMAQIGAGEGSIEEKENRIFHNLLGLRLVTVGDIMTPRTVAYTLREDMTVDEVVKEIKALPYSRIPIYKEDRDNIEYYVLSSDILAAAAEDNDRTTLKELSRPLHSVPETLSADRVLDEFIARKEHIFLVFDEYGGTAGIITLEDVIETLLGIEITDESDIVADMRQLAQQRYQQRYESRTRLESRKADEASVNDAEG